MGKIRDVAFLFQRRGTCYSFLKSQNLSKGEKKTKKNRGCEGRKENIKWVYGLNLGGFRAALFFNDLNMTRKIMGVWGFEGKWRVRRVLS